jgi:DnaJ-class molecular chaperone
MRRRSSVCLNCDEHTFLGNGRCSHCHGSGVNLRLTSDEPKCPACGGTGICATCGGEGVFNEEADEDHGLQFLDLG